ncbi:MAG: NMD3-related protein [Thermoplasmataceae archaeon]
MICVKCGDRLAIQGGLCESCIEDSIRIRRSGNIDIAVCPKCGSVKLRNRWLENPKGSDYAKHIETYIEIENPGLTLEVDPDSVSFDADNGIMLFNATASGDKFRSEPMPMKEDVRVAWISCPSCNKRTGSHHEAILQIRSSSGMRTQLVSQACDRALQLMERSMEGHRSSYVSRIADLKEGIDIYLGRKADGEKLAKEIGNEFFSITTVNKKLAGRKEGYDLYRYTYLIRLLDVGCGSVLSREGVKYIVERVNTSSIVMINSETGAEISLSRNEYYNSGFSITEDSAELERFIVISSRNGETELMDPATFKSHIVKISTSKKEILGLLYHEKVFILGE